jgi:uncharacterized membrane protein YjjP (DUF1212 family)
MPDDNVQIHERLARIEERLKQLDDVAEQMDELQREMARYRGLLGGILLAVTAIVTVVKMFGGSIADMFKTAVKM